MQNFCHKENTEKYILVVMATAKLKTQNEKGRFLHHSIHNNHFNKSHSHSISHAVFSRSVTWVLFIVIPYSLQCSRHHDSAHDISAAPSGFAACNMWSTSAFLLLTSGEKARSPSTAHHGSCCPLSTWNLTSFSMLLK